MTGAHMRNGTDRHLVRGKAARVHAVCLALSLMPLVQAATTINLSTNVTVAAVKHFGLNFGNVDYYDSGQLMKELVFQNPGFEGLLYQSVIWVGATGNSPTNAVENGPLNAWPSGFWAGARYEFIYGFAKGRTGTVVTSINPYSAGGNTNGTTYVFADSGTTPAAGDYLVLRKQFTGDGGVANNNGAAFSGWNVSTNAGGTVTTELADLPQDTAGKQCARLTATNGASANAAVSGTFDTWGGVSFVQLNGQYQLNFKAKGAGGNNQLAVTLRRGSGTNWLNSTVQLTNLWQTYTLTFSAAEDGTALGGVALQFAAWAGNVALLDDVSLRQTDGNPANVTPLRDAVFNTLTNFAPSILRVPGNWSRLGDSLDNELAPPFGRQRNYYSEFSTQQNTIPMSLHEFLQVCEALGAEPWYTFPVTFSAHETAGLMEYLGGPTNTAYGRVRANLGHPAPWTNVFAKIHLEFGNENWNPGYRGGCLSDSLSLGTRAGELFAVIKSSPYYDSAKFDCVLGEQWVFPARVLATHNACTNHDTLTVAGYMANTLNSFATTEQLFGSVFAEPEWWSKNGGFIQQNYSNLLNSSRPVPLSIYEVNINAPEGAISGSQPALDAYCPSLGAGLAVADHMLMMLRETRTRDQGLFSLGGYEARNASNNWARVWGIVRDMGVTDRKRPQYLACQLANRALAGNMLATVHTGEDPTWSVVGVNGVTCTNAHYVQSYAFANGGTNALVVFNLHRSSALGVNFSGARTPSGNVVMQRLTSAQLTDNNETSQVIATTAQTLTNLNPSATLSLPPYSMTLLQWQPTLVISNLAQLPDGAVGVGYSQSLAAVNGTLPYAWTLAAGALPGGLVLNSAGLISGTPDAAGMFSFSARVVDAALATNVQAFALTIVTPTAPQVTISRAAGQAGNTTNASLQFAVTFSEVVAGFSAGDILVGGTAGATQIAISGSGASYTVTLSGMTNSGTVTLSLAAGAVTSVTSGLGSAASQPADGGYNYALPPALNRLLAYDDFNIATNATPVPPFLDGAATGTNWAGAWVVQGFNGGTNYTDGFKILATNAPASGTLRTTGNYAVGGGASYATAGRFLDLNAFPAWTFVRTGTNVIGASGAELWLSVLLRKNTLDDNMAAVILHNGSAAYNAIGNSRLGVGYYGTLSNTNGQRYWSLAVRNAADTGIDVIRSGVPVVAGQAALLVLRMRFNTTDTFDLFVNPAGLGGATPAAPDATWTTSGAADIFFRALAFSGNNALNSMALDEIRWGDSFAAVTPPGGAGTVQFSGANYSANEDGGSATIFVTRSGGSSGAASVTWGTGDGTALAGSDYTATNSTLTWADGDMSTKAFTVALANTPALQGNRALHVALTSASGVTLGAVSSAALTINDVVLLPFDVWRAAHFAPAAWADANLSGPAADPDHDGGSNLQEYLADTDPTNAASRLALLDIAVANNDVWVTWVGGTNATQVLECSSSLTDTNAWFALRTNTPPVLLTNTLQHIGAGAASNLFYRIRAWR